MKRIVRVFLLVAVICLTLTLCTSATDGGESSLISPLWLIVCLVVGFLLALIPMGILKGQIRNVHNKYEATDYTREGSFNLQIKEDIFRNRTVTKVAIPKNNNNK